VSRVLRIARHSIGHFGDGLSRQNARTHNNGTKSLTFYRKFNLYKTYKKQKKTMKPIIVSTAECRLWLCILSKMAVLIIFPVILQTIINLITPSIGGQGADRSLGVHRPLQLFLNNAQGGTSS